MERFEEMGDFPLRDDFFSSLTKSLPSESDYAHGKKVFTTFRCSNMKEYILLYNKLDVGLLLECLTQFRLLGMPKFGLDMSHYISLP